MSLLLKRVAASSQARCLLNFTKQLRTKEQLLPASHLSFTRTEATLPPTDKSWTPIYRLPLIQWAASFNRLKFYQTLVTAVGVPAVYALEQAGMVSTGTNVVFAIVGLSGILTLTLCSLGPQNLIGFIYINEQQDRVKLAYLDFWGRRQETEIDLSDIIPECEQARPSRYDFYKKICLYSDPKRKYKVLPRYGVILEPEQFSAVVGE